MTVLFRHEIVVAFDEQRAILVDFFVDEFQTSQNSFALLFADSICNRSKYQSKHFIFT